MSNVDMAVTCQVKVPFDTALLVADRPLEHWRGDIRGTDHTLFVSPDLEDHSGAVFNRKGEAILPTPTFTEEYVQRAIAASEALLARS